MLPIQDLLNRIQWDKTFGQADFRIGYFDRVEKRVVVVPFSRIVLTEDRRFSFQLVGEEEQGISIPLHRIREVYKNGQLIWSRPL